jgi:hypothetical protein
MSLINLNSFFDTLKMEKTEKLFLKWWKRKFQIENNNVIHRIKKREFWLYNVWVNIWDESSKEEPFLRPCLILNNYLSWDLALIIPLTSKFNPKLKYIYYKIDWNKYWLIKDSYLILNQFRVISKKRLSRVIRKNWKNSSIDKKIFLLIIEKIRNMI